MAELLPVHALLNGTAVDGYFRTSDVYGETGGIGAKVGIKKVKDVDLTGKERILTVKELLRTADLQRIGIRYKDASGKRKSARILVSGKKLQNIFGDTPADKLEGVSYKVGEKPAKGNIVSIGQIRRATTY